MKRVVLASVFLVFAFGLSGCGRQRTSGTKAPARDYPIKPVPFASVRFTDGFWAPRLETNRTRSIPYAFEMNESTGRVDNFRKAARLLDGPHKGKRYNDSDIFKAMEAAAYTLLLRPDPELERKLDELIAVIGKAQEPDGYLYTPRTIDPAHPAPGAGGERWSNLRVSHELYNVGHMYEAAVAHYQATGKRTFLDIALENAGLLLRTFGPGLKHGFPGHQEVEIGLAKLYRVTGDRAYLDLAKFFLDERGRYHQGGYYADSDPFSVYNSEEYLQNHKPVLEQTEAVGHAVRAMYMYSGMADVAAMTGSPEYVAAIDWLWTDVVGSKMYLTGGVGARHTSESFGDAYELPNAEAYTETCASVGNAFWQHRLFLLHGDARYMDVFERVLYNGLLSGVSLSGDRFFYQNPLESAGDYERSPWFEVACCPPNITRFLPSLPGYVYALKEDTVFVNLFVASEAGFAVKGTEVMFRQETRYPWEGVIRIMPAPARPLVFNVAVRVPGWARGEAAPEGLYRFSDVVAAEPVLKVNGVEQPLELENGYVNLRREWKNGDAIELFLPMPVRLVAARDDVAADRGRVAIQRGPLVYCAEAVDNGGRALDIIVPEGAALYVRPAPGLLNGVVVVGGKVKVLERGSRGRSVEKEHELAAVPYYAWANRGRNEMTVWFARTAAAVKRPELVNRDVD